MLHSTGHPKQQGTMGRTGGIVSMQFGYHQRIFDTFPSLVAGVSFITGVENASGDDLVSDLLAKQQDIVRQTLQSATLSTHPHIASWRTAYSAFGTKPARYNCAVELLLRRVLKDGQIPSINKVVDICNYVSMRHVLPVAALDVERLQGPVEVRFAAGGEHFLPIHASEAETAEPGEVVYMDDVEALSRRWNWRQCDKAKVTEVTRTALFTTEGINQVDRSAVEETLQELVQLLRRHCGGRVFQFVLDRDHPLARVAE